MEQIVQLRRGPHGRAVVRSDIERDEARLDLGTVPADVDVEALYRDLRENVRGEVRFDRASRGLYATDGSNYRQPPIGVVVPADEQDVVAAVEVVRRHGAPLLGRGAGTSLAGQCCNVAVVIDFSKYMDRVKSLDARRRTAVVQPGCVLDDLREAAQPKMLTFGPDPSTHSHCTMGGMIGNNACGIHATMSEFYGPGARTDQNIAEMEVLTYDGLRLRVGPTPEDELERIIAAGGRRGQIYGDLRDLRDRYIDELRHGFPRMQRRVSGYNLPALLPEEGFDVARALVGTEGTCALVLEATAKLIPHFRHQALLLLGYDSIYEAGDHVAELRELRPIGFEAMDDRLIDYMKKSDLHPEYARHLPEGGGWLMLEFGGDSATEAREQAEQAASRIGNSGAKPHAKVIDDPEVMHKIWIIRESGLGATAFVPGEPDAWEGWEDSAVPPEYLGDYLRDFRRLLDRYGYGCSLYGHFAQGCVHTRIDFRLADRHGIEDYRRFTDEAADLVVSYGGSLSGEHGDGQSRGDLLHKMYGPRIMEAFREFKRIWDPEGKMNPGKVIDAAPRTANLRLGADYEPWRPPTYFRYPEDEGDFAHAALRCVGVGKCRRKDEGTMCPSYQVTREEKHTTRGRAHLLFEMLQGEVITDGWRSEEVKESLDLCLSCKGCKGECPVHVDMATYKAEFLAHYYRHNRRPRHAYAFGWIHRWARIGAEVPELANLVARTPGLRDVARWLAGMTRNREIPRFARRTFKGEMRRRGTRQGGRPAILWADTFNNHFYPDTLLAAVEALEHAGYTVMVPRAPLCCGRALYEYGMLDLAVSLWRKNLKALRGAIRAGVPVVGVEPSCVAAFRDELQGLFPDDDDAVRLGEQTYTLEELLVQQGDDWRPPRLERKAILHGHCHEKSILDFGAEIRVLERLGLEVEALDSGCCGLAGSFGFEPDKYELSMAAGERVLFPAARGAGDGELVVADGFSCREQVAAGAGLRPMHVAEVIRMALRHGVG